MHHLLSRFVGLPLLVALSTTADPFPGRAADRVQEGEIDTPRLPAHGLPAQQAGSSPLKVFVLAGFVWYHGWNDGCEPDTAVPQYETNLVNLIKDVCRELNTPNLPVVIGELTGPWVQAPGEWATLRQAQAAAAMRPEFEGNVLFVETHDFVRKSQESLNPGHGHHEFGNAETCLLVGKALGQGMKALVLRPGNGPGVRPGHYSGEGKNG